MEELKWTRRIKVSADDLPADFPLIVGNEDAFAAGKMKVNSLHTASRDGVSYYLLSYSDRLYDRTAACWALVPAPFKDVSIICRAAPTTEKDHTWVGVHRSNHSTVETCKIWAQTFNWLNQLKLDKNLTEGHIDSVAEDLKHLRSRRRTLERLCEKYGV